MLESTGRRLKVSNERESAQEAVNLAGIVLGEVNEQAEVSQALSEKRANGKKTHRAALLGAILLGLTATHILTLSDSGPPLPADQLRYSMLDEMSSLVFDLDDFRDANGVYPENLSIIGLPEIPAWRYQRLDQDQYRISFQEGGQTLAYESDDSADIFFAEARSVE